MYALRGAESALFDITSAYRSLAVAVMYSHFSQYTAYDHSLSLVPWRLNFVVILSTLCAIAMPLSLSVNLFVQAHERLADNNASLSYSISFASVDVLRCSTVCLFSGLISRRIRE